MFYNTNSFQYLCELTLLDADPYLKYLPSTIAASSVVLALHTLGLPSWVTLFVYKLLSIPTCNKPLVRDQEMCQKYGC